MYIQNRKPFYVYTVTRNDAKFMKRLYTVASKIVANDFVKRGKAITTQKGAYRVDYTKAVDVKFGEILDICFDKNRLSVDLCKFFRMSVPDARNKDIAPVILRYLADYQGRVSDNFDNFMNGTKSLTPDEFFEVKGTQSGDVVGVYVIHNDTNGMYYVGQAKRLFFRVNQHFTGHGNGDVYADYKHGDHFSIQLMKLSDSGYSDLDKLERDLIEKYDAYNSGYNRTVGNK